MYYKFGPWSEEDDPEDPPDEVLQEIEDNPVDTSDAEEVTDDLYE